MEDMVSGSSRTGYQQEEIVWVVNIRVAGKTHSSATHTSKEIIVPNRDDQNTLEYIRNCT